MSRKHRGLSFTALDLRFSRTESLICKTRDRFLSLPNPDHVTLQAMQGTKISTSVQLKKTFRLVLGCSMVV